MYKLPPSSPTGQSSRLMQLFVKKTFSGNNAFLQSNSAVVRTAWCSEIGSLWSLEAPELHASVTSENQFHCTRLYTIRQTAVLFD